MFFRSSLPALLGLVVAGVLMLPASLLAQDSSEVHFQNGRFEPATFVVPANQPVKLKVVNKGDKPIEFESFELNRERVVPAGRTVTVYLPSLTAGTYHFYDDLNRDAGTGTLIAK